MHDQRSADPPFVHPMFVFTEGCVAHIGPVSTIGNVSVGRTWHYSFAAANPAAVARLHGRPDLRLQIVGTEGSEICGWLAAAISATHRFSATAVVLQEEDHRIFQLLLTFKFRDNSTNSTVHTIHHRRIHLHAS